MNFNKIIGINTKMSASVKPAITYSNGGEWQNITFFEFEAIVNETQDFLLKFGIKKRDRIIILGENHAKWLPIFIGIANYGAIAVPIDAQVSGARLLNILNDCKPKLIITSKQCEEKVILNFNDISFDSALVNFYFDLIQARGNIQSVFNKPEPPVSNDPALIIYTSGTTGAPKGITHSHYSVMSACEQSSVVGDITEKDTMMTLLPYTHAFGLIASGLLPYYMGITNVLAGVLNPIEILTIVNNFNVNNICIVPRIAEIFANILSQMARKLPGIKLTIGGANCPAGVIKILKSLGMIVGFGYGMTEICGPVCVSYDGPAGSVGKAVPPVMMKIDRPNKDSIGELLIYSPANTVGIFGRPELNKFLWSDGNFIKTGDMAKIDHDGYIYIMGRSKDVIVTSGGMNVYPDELENRIGSVVYLKEFCIVGIEKDNLEQPVLIYRVNEEFFAKNAIANFNEFVEEKIKAVCADWPDWEKISQFVELKEPFPRSYSYKIQRNSLIEIIKYKAEFEKAQKESSTPGLEKEIEVIFDKIRPIVSNLLNIPENEFSIYKPLAKFNKLDSLGKMSMLAYLQHKFSLEVSELSRDDFNTFHSLIKTLLKTNSAAKFLHNEIDVNVEPGTAKEFPGAADMQAAALPLDYSKTGIEKRQEFLESKTGADLSVIKSFDYSGSEKLQGNIENMFGYCQIPVGMAGPLKVNGKYANDNFYIPLATTEGALVASISRGANAITAAGGADTLILADSVCRTPIFLFENLKDMADFSEWLKSNFEKIKTAAESTTRHGKLLEISQYPVGSKLCLRFSYFCGDASGQNMSTIATHKALEFIKQEYKGNISDYFLECNLSGDKKVNAINFTQNRGKKVTAEVTLCDEILKNILNTTAERMHKVYEVSVIGMQQAHSYGLQAHYSNAFTALYIACGQDPACAAESACGITNIEKTGSGIKISVTLPGVMVGTVGGGTKLPTQKACLEILKCAGEGGALKLAEITAAAVLAGEISLIAAMASDEFTSAHSNYGRNAGARS